MLSLLLFACTSSSPTSDALEASFALGDAIPNAVEVSIESDVEGVVFV